MRALWSLHLSRRVALFRWMRIGGRMWWRVNDDAVRAVSQRIDPCVRVGLAAFADAI